MLTDLQKKAVQAIVNIFETGKVLGDYSNVTSHPQDPGGLTYGRSQTTLNSGNLHLLIKDYCNAVNAEFAAQLTSYLPRLKNKDRGLNNDQNLHNILRQAGKDAVMQSVQDTFFDRIYWNPSVNSANNQGIQTALGVAVVYDSVIHGSWVEMRDRTNERFGTVANIGEQTWIKHYISVRRDWLANSNNSLLRKTVYRMDILQEIINSQNWDLALPLTVRGLIINDKSLNEQFSFTPRSLRLQQPFMQGKDVVELQKALVKVGFQMAVDGIFGPATDKAVKQFQKDKDLIVDGIVGTQTRELLGLITH
jgi:chitosanase